MTMTDASRMPFGKFKGQPMKEVPAAYLDWLHGQAWITRSVDTVPPRERGEPPNGRDNHRGGQSGLPADGG
jgi:hypothetical protein